MVRKAAGNAIWRLDGSELGALEDLAAAFVASRAFVGNEDDLIHALGEALAIAHALVPPPVVLIAQLDSGLAGTLVQTDERGKAQHALEDAIAVERAFDPDSLALAMTLLNYGQLAGAHDYETGLHAFAEAEQILEHKHDGRANYATASLAVLEAAHGRWDDARKHVEVALAFEERDPGADPANVAQLQFLLAESLVETHGDRKRAHVLAVGARDALVKLGPGAAAFVTHINRWLAAHP